MFIPSAGMNSLRIEEDAFDMLLSRDREFRVVVTRITRRDPPPVDPDYPGAGSVIGGPELTTDPRSVSSRTVMATKRISDQAPD